MSQPRWVQQAQAALHEIAQQDQAQRKAKHRALVGMATRRRDPLGKFLRSKPAKRYNATNRTMQRVSVPLALYDTFVGEADDVKLSFSRFLLVCAALGLPLWRDLKEHFITGTYDEIVIPELVKRILDEAAYPTPPRSARSRAAWQSRVEDALAGAKRKPKLPPKDPTAAVLAGLGGGK